MNAAPILRGLAALRAAVAGWRRAGETVAVVPTMGALHEGHLSLVRAARQGADRVVVTIFVNPRQFNNPEDLANYPRTEGRDAELLAPLAVDAVFVPDVEDVYPQGFSTTVSVEGVSAGLCGAHRPGHFDGVATVVAKLFLMTGADRAYFGEKDYQQLLVVRRLARDLNIPIAVIGCPTVREGDGLALSSRNMRLSAAERAIAPALPQAMGRVAAALAAGGALAPALEAARAEVVAAGYASVEYLELRAADDLRPLTAPGVPARLLAAAWLGPVRLIDNIAIPPRGA
ncbi:pantoate--beta-alanine ligase [Ruixingdingia sedimenti]|uniref:Pantothenate synthetase n=1 Tax=Ruixingdingia sedimenti TaxID=3073604 RepID=A0ABU1FEH5_9RHOB|nr:pantoate--beta-alanine ligase [Xinfangfangia sp. LG-4]MDR5654958.1 pantoate--beta-alanine ligase [Xinfangfangia sp. LG-4]